MKGSSTIYYVANICGLIFGAYLVVALSAYRILVLYCLFNVVLFWIANRGTFDGPKGLGLFKGSGKSHALLDCLAVSVVMLMSILVLSSYDSLYSRPSSTSPLLAVSILLMSILALANIVFRERSVFTRTRFLLPVLIAVALFANFSTYLVQPALFARPLFATEDAYRDFVNAARIITMSGLRPENMVKAQYYATFPAVPVLISLISLVLNVPVQEAQTLMAVAIEILGVVTVWIFSTYAVRTFLNSSLAVPIGVLTTVFVWLQPYLTSPSNIFAPDRLSIPLVTLIMYLAHRRIIQSKPLGNFVLLPIIILTMAIVPMHATSAIAVLGFFALTGLIMPRIRHGMMFSVTLITLVIFSLYLVSSGGLAFDSLTLFVRNTSALFTGIISKGPQSITEARALRIFKFSEINSWMQSLPLGLALSICTTVIPISLLKHHSQGRFSLLNATYGILAFMGLSLGYLAQQFPSFGIDMRYFAYPLTGLIVIACAIVLGLALRNTHTLKVTSLILVVITVMYAVSMTSSPTFLYESNPATARIIPTISERAAGDFVSNTLQLTNAPSQILTDYPFYDYIEGLIYSHNIGIEDKINIVDTLVSSPNNREQTTVILRQYYLQNTWLKRISTQTGVLDNPDKWNSPEYNKIFDSSTTSVYIDSSTTSVRF